MSNTTRANTNGNSAKTGVVLWIIQIVLALLFLFAGGMKLVVPIDALAQQTQLPGLFMKLIGLCEFLGAFGLILPGLLRIRPELTSAAAVGLVIIMSGAATITIENGPAAGAVVPAIVGLLSAVVAHGRKQPVPSRQSSRRSVLQLAR
jgi:DoxX-like protein